MQRFIQHRGIRRTQTNREPLSPRLCQALAAGLWILLLTATAMLSGCGGSSNGGNNNAPNANSISGNWQFTVANPSDGSFIGGLLGGFLLQNSSSVTGGAVYSVALPGQNGGNPTVCNSGSASITGTFNSPNVTLTAVAGTQTFTFTGTMSADGSTIVGTYNSTAGTASGGSPCGTVQNGLQWSAVSIPALSGVVVGNFHSTGGGAGLNNQDFAMSGLLTQGQNVGASNATITGSITFIDPTTQLSDYPCFDTASVNGTISGNSVILQLIGVDGSNLGQIGGAFGSGLGNVTFDRMAHGYVLHSAVGTAYAVNSKPCPGSGVTNPGDSGNICFALQGTTACQQPVTISPAFLTFPAQQLGTITTQTITLTNSSPSSQALNGLQLQWSFGSGPAGPSDFNGLPNFTEMDTCAPLVGSTFSLAFGQSCTITISFAPQESCPWIPYGTPPSILGAAPDLCPLPLTASLTLNSPASADNDTIFAIPVTGYGASALTPSTAELDFGAEAPSGASLPQTLSFTNRGASPVQILGHAPCLNNPPDSGHNSLPRPLQDSSPVAGLQVVANGPGSVGGSIFFNGATVVYSCDSDPTSQLPNFQISSDTCTGTLLAPQATCGLQVAYVPQPGTSLTTGLDFFLELNTVQCTSTVTSSCEIDSGRFPVEIRADAASPLRMTPGAGLDFGLQTVGHSSAKQNITLFNDPTDPHAGTVTFVGKISATGDYSEGDDCPASLAPGSSCTITIGFKPKVVGPDPGTVVINYTPEPTGAPQIIYVRGTGQ